MNDTISWNNIFLNDTLCQKGTGIGVFNDNGDQIIGNTISMNNHSSASDYTGDSFTGIYAEMSQNCFVTCNQTNYLTNHILFYDDQTFSGVFNNTMTSGNDTLTSTGIELMGATVALGPQGNISSSSDNQWNGLFNCRSNVPTPADPYLSIFFVQSGAVYNPDGGGCTQQIVTDSAGPSSLNCSTLHSMVLSRTLMDSIAKAQIAYLEYPDTAKRISKQALASTIWNKQELLAEPTLYHFNDSISGTSLGQLMAVDSMMNSKVYYDPTTLLSSVSAITPASNIEANMQTAAQIHLQAKATKTKVLTNAQTANLTTLANYCPFTDGIGVYQARTLLAFYNGNFNIYDWINCDRSRDEIHRPSKNNIDSTKNILFNLYPNPNNGNFTLTYSLGSDKSGKVIIYNQIGMEVANYLLTSASGIMAISNPYLSQGVYIYKVFTSNEVRVGKIVIMK